MLCFPWFQDLPPFLLQSIIFLISASPFLGWIIVVYGRTGRRVGRQPAASRQSKMLIPTGTRIQPLSRQTSQRLPTPKSQVVQTNFTVNTKQGARTSPLKELAKGGRARRTLLHHRWSSSEESDVLVSTATGMYFWYHELEVARRKASSRSCSSSGLVASARQEKQK
jgi:hypothetical protein